MEKRKERGEKGKERKRKGKEKERKGKEKEDKTYEAEGNANYSHFLKLENCFGQNGRFKIIQEVD